MTRRYPGKPQKMRVKPCPTVNAWVRHAPHEHGGRWCPGFNSKDVRITRPTPSAEKGQANA